jgi:hypothetical protein
VAPSQPSGVVLQMWRSMAIDVPLLGLRLEVDKNHLVVVLAINEETRRISAGTCQEKLTGVVAHG